jgi:hypothetical protein
LKKTKIKIKRPNKKEGGRKSQWYSHSCKYICCSDCREIVLEGKQRDRLGWLFTRAKLLAELVYTIHGIDQLQ